jgi:hypothetical protein
MFGSDDRSKKLALGAMAGEAHNACQANKIEAEKMLATMIANDGRFAAHDPAALARRVGICGGSGAQLDLEDTALLRGGSPRPLSDPRFR